MAIWERPRHVQVDVRDNVTVDAYGASEEKAEKALRAYAGDKQVEEWRRNEQIKSEPYKGDKEGVEINYRRQVKGGDEPLPGMPEAIRVRVPEDAAAAAEPKKANRQLEYNAVGDGDVRTIRIENIPPGANVVININLAQFGTPPKKPTPELQEEFRKTLNTALERVDVIEKQLSERDARMTPSQDRRSAVEQGVKDSLPGEVVSRTQAAAVRQAVSDELNPAPARSVSAEELSQRARGPSGAPPLERGEAREQPARAERAGREEPAEPGAERRAEAAEFRGTIVEAIKEAERRGVVAFQPAGRDPGLPSRLETPGELARTIERVREQIAPEAKDEKVYTVRSDGTIHNTVTRRDEYTPAAPEVARAGHGDPRAEKDGPREGPAPGARGPRDRTREEPEVSVSMS